MPKPLKVPSLARSVPKPLKVPSLARSVPKPLKVLIRERKKRKKIKEGHKINDEKETKVWKASPCWTVTPALRGPRREPTCIDGWVMGDGWMDGWVMDGWVGNNLFFFCLFLKIYSIYDSDCFHAP